MARMASNGPSSTAFEWRILSYDGEPVDADGPTDSDRISFVVEWDLIVAYEWS